MNATPAPWISRPVPSDSVDGKTSFWIDAENGAPLADVRTRPDDEHVVNARLIAAAPDLFKQLDNAVSMLESVWNKENIPPALLRVTIDEARAALAKVQS